MCVLEQSKFGEKKRNQQYEKKITFNSTISKIISFMLSLLGEFEQVYKTKCKESIKSVNKLSSLLPHTKDVNGSTYSVAKKNGERRNNSFFLLSLQQNVFSVTKKFVTKSPVFRH